MHDLTGFRFDPVIDPLTRVSRIDSRFTDAVISQTGPDANPRIADLFTAFVFHIHTLCREMKVTTPEFNSFMQFIARAAKDEQLMLLVGLCGLGALCDETTFKIEQEGLQEVPTAYTGIGPYYRSGAPVRESGSSIVSGFEKADHVFMFGRVLDARTGAPIAGAELDLWQAGDNGLYDHEDPDQPTWNLRGRFITSNDGTYSLRCLRPTPYPIPTEGTAGDFLRLLDRHPMRPGHIHFKVTAEGYLPLITELYEANDKYLDSDVVFDVHDSVIMQFKRRLEQNGDGCDFELEHDFKIISKTVAKERGMKAAEDSIQLILDPY